MSDELLPHKYIAKLIDSNNVSINYELSNKIEHIEVPDLILFDDKYYRLKSLANTNDHEFTCTYLEATILIINNDLLDK